MHSIPKYVTKPRQIGFDFLSGPNGRLPSESL